MGELERSKEAYKRFVEAQAESIDKIIDAHGIQDEGVQGFLNLLA
jgi:hypothetical protein